MSVTATIKAIGAMAVVIFCAVIVGALAFLAGPQIEAKAFPVINALSVAGTVKREPGSVCWSTHFIKHRTGTPAYFDYRLVARGDRITVAPYKLLPDGKHVYLSTYAFASHAAGEAWDSRYCVDIPSSIDDHQSFVIEGDSIYDTVNPFWQLRAPLPSFEVPGLP